MLQLISDLLELLNPIGEVFVQFFQPKTTCPKCGGTMKRLPKLSGKKHRGCSDCKIEWVQKPDGAWAEKTRE
ncbi:MAG TPA: hypothetical protein VGO50_20535 [Pyrinomonadaceae bacterium]|jgi:hypothetical protein|nr:hypothetical protein [Pyrinomonadaceae bacterium]